MCRGVLFDRETNNFVDFETSAKNGAYYISKYMLVRCVTVSETTQTPLVLNWSVRNNDYVILDIGQPQENSEKAIGAAKVWAKEHNMALIITK